MTFNKIIFALIANLLILTWPTLLAAQDLLSTRQLKARPNIQISSALVTLGDLFEYTGSKSEIAVFRAPAPGKTGYIRAARLKEATRKHGLVWKNINGLPRINIARQSRIISAADITASIRKKLIESSSMQDEEGMIDLRFAKMPAPIHLPLEVPANFNVDNVNYNSGNGRFTAAINTAGEDGRPARLIYYSGQAIRTMKIPVLIHPVPRGSIIRLDDIANRNIPVKRLKRAPLKLTKDLIGMAARRNLRANTALFKRDIERPQIVRRNSLVRIILKTPGLALTTKGKALSNGAFGEVIDVLNVRSKRVIQVTVIASNTVSPIVAGAPLTGRTTMANAGQGYGETHE